MSRVKKAELGFVQPQPGWCMATTLISAHSLNVANNHKSAQILTWGYKHILVSRRIRTSCVHNSLRRTAQASLACHVGLE